MIIETQTTDGWLSVGHDDGVLSLIPFSAIASWSELTGIDDPVEVVEAIEQVNRVGEAAADPVTKENAWTAALTLLSHREKHREQAAADILTQGQPSIHRPPALYGEIAAYRAVHVPVNGGECVMNRCRRAFRETYEIGDPTAIRTVGSRSSPPTIGEGAGNSDRQQIAAALRGHEDELMLCTRRFLHALSGRKDNPLSDVPCSSAQGDPLDPRDVFQRFGGSYPVDE